MYVNEDTPHAHVKEKIYYWPIGTKYKKGKNGVFYENS
jgi:hypothetical protein